MKWVERQRCLIDFTLSSLWRRKWKNLSLLSLYSLVVFILSSVLFFTQALRQEAGEALSTAPEMIVQRMVGGRHALIPQDYVEKIRGIRGVRAAKPRMWGYYFNMVSRTNYTLMVPDEFPHGPMDVVVGEGVARSWGSIEDDQLYFSAYDREAMLLHIAGTLDAETGLVSSDLILMSEPLFRKISGVPEGFATDIAVTIRNQRESDTIAQKIVRALPDTRPITRADILRTYAAVFDWRSGYVIVILSAAGLAFLIFAWDKATGLSAEEKSEIGILKGVGWETSDILGMKFWEGGVISVLAYVIGITGAYVHVFLSSAPLFEHALKGWSGLYPSIRLAPAVDIYSLSVLFFLSVLPYTLATLIPAWRIAVTDPDIAMRRG